MKKIIVKERSNDYHASLKGHPEIYGCGKSYKEAVGSLILAHRDKFNIEVEGQE